MFRISRRPLLVAVVAGTLAAGCATREQSGALIGGATGAAVGSTIGQGSGRTAAIILGTLAGTVIGTTLGRYMDEQDRMRTVQTLEYNRTDQPTSWVNPDTGNSYVVTPTHTTYGSSGSPCREFTLQADVSGRNQQVYGTACRQPDGSWKMMQ